MNAPDREIRTSVYELGAMLFGLVGLLVALALAGLFNEQGGSIWFSLTGLTLVLSIPFFVAVMRGRFDPFEPIYIVCASYFLYLVYAPARDFLNGKEHFFGRHVMPLVPLGSLYAGLSIAAMIGAYYLRIGSPAARLRPMPPESMERLRRSALIFGAMGILGFSGWLVQSGRSWLGFLTLGQFGGGTETFFFDETGATNYFLVSVELLIPAFVLLYATMTTRRVWLIPAFLLPMLIYTTLGFRYRLLILVLAPIVYRYLQQRRRPNILSLLFALAVTIIFIGAMAPLRQSFRVGKEITAQDVMEVEAVENFNTDLDIYQPYLAMIDAMPLEEDFLWGQSFTYLLIHPIPRAIWRGKPDSPARAVIRAAFRGDNAPIASGVAYPNFAEFYANFGLAGMILGMAVFGFGMRKVQDFLHANRESPLAVAIFALTLPFLVQVVSRGYLVQIFQEFAFIIAPLMILRRFPGPLPRVPRAAPRAAALPGSVRAGPFNRPLI